jgi:hypothetical protein
MNTLIKLRRGLRTEWENFNPVLSDGEAGVEIDTHKLKIGDGQTLWNDLSYIDGESAQHYHNLLGNPNLVITGTNSVGISLDNQARTLSDSNALSIVGGKVGINTLTPSVSLDNSGVFKSNQVQYTVSNITSLDNNILIASSAIIRLSFNSEIDIDGMSTGLNGEIRLLFNAGVNNLNLLNNEYVSNSNSKFIIYNNTDYILAPNHGVSVLYDSVSNCWRVF